MTEEINSYLASLEEYVFDEKKIVTCSWLSKALGIHTNLSKQLLYSFFEKSPKKDELSLTYLLIGSPNHDGGCQVSIIKDKDLEKCENSWKLITSKHIYSVQKCSDLSDLNVLYTAQKDVADTSSKGISAIDFNCNERDSSLIAKLRSDALPVVSKQPLGASKKTVPQPPAPVNSKSPFKNKEDKSIEENKAAAGKNKGSVVPSMFKNSKPAENKTVSTNKAAEKATVGSKKPQGIGAFFSKATNKQGNEPKKQKDEIKKATEEESKSTERHSPSKENKPTLNIVTDDKIVKEGIVKEDKTSESPKKASPKNKKPVVKQKASAKKNNSKKRPGKKVEKQKKRKRLVVASDSESENSSEGEEEVIREQTPEPQPTIVPDDDDDDDIISATPEPATRKRKRKLINKSYKTSDGYMMTKKEYVDVSCSEEEEETVPEKKAKGNSQDTESAKQSGTSKSEPPTKSPPGKNKSIPKATKASPQKTKQASLTSFFKKK